VPEEQPSPKKQKIDDSRPTNNSDPRTSNNNMERGYKTGAKQVSGKGDSEGTSRIFASAPGKISYASKHASTQECARAHDLKGKGNNASVNINLSEEDVIPVAIYEPSKDLNEEDSLDTSKYSEDFESKVNKALGDEAESSKNREVHWFADCGLVSTGDVTQSIFLNKTILPPSVKIFEILEVNEFQQCSEKDAPSQNAVSGLRRCGQQQVHSEGVLDLQLLENPCEKMKKQRQERRASERLQNNLNEK